MFGVSPSWACDCLNSAKFSKGHSGLRRARIVSCFESFRPTGANGVFKHFIGRLGSTV